MRRKTIITTVEWCIAILLVFLYFKEGHTMNGSLTAAKAHQLSERSYHYGPSQIVREVPYGKDTVIFLGLYKDWFSADTSVKQRMGWYPGGGVSGVAIDKSKPLTYFWEISQLNKTLRLGKFFGYVSDPKITTVVLNMVYLNDKREELNKTIELRESIKEDRMFLFLWNELENQYRWKSIQGMDDEGKVLYEYSFE
ncbi:hypothetical protein [Cohnella abietis]|uniref:Uncharacterized protein n=1 Tax=Cohnella abietis TaxID=2507935 RepID=A0A3T1D844_9BACL|nr:hypothetical protein [Cohnella abietis]BBI34252.1 hypothetical protein KCTCHS21_36510 [Cohnella abietis]